MKHHCTKISYLVVAACWASMLPMPHARGHRIQYQHQGDTLSNTSRSPCPTPIQAGCSVQHQLDALSNTREALCPKWEKCHVQHQQDALYNTKTSRMPSQTPTPAGCLVQNQHYQNAIKTTTQARYPVKYQHQQDAQSNINWMPFPTPTAGDALSKTNWMPYLTPTPGRYTLQHRYQGEALFNTNTKRTLSPTHSTRRMPCPTNTSTRETPCPTPIPGRCPVQHRHKGDALSNTSLVQHQEDIVSNM